MWIKTIHKLHFFQKKPVLWFLEKLFTVNSLLFLVFSLHCTNFCLCLFTIAAQHNMTSFPKPYRKLATGMIFRVEIWAILLPFILIAFFFASLLEATPDCSLNPPTLLSKLIRHTNPRMSTLILEFPSIVAGCICVSLLLLGGR